MFKTITLWGTDLFSELVLKENYRIVKVDANGVVFC